jgi:3-oxoacyl-[acyl-carrier protein] reductase
MPRSKSALPVPTDRSLDGMVAIVTGGASGMGLAHAKLLLQRGAKLAITNVDPETLNAAVATLDAGDRLLALSVDNRDVAAIKAGVKKIEAKFGKVDILVNNAGISGNRLLLDQIDEAAFDGMFAAHVKGAFFFAQAVVPGMKARKFGRIINISSNFSMAGSIAASHYTAAKSAMNGMTRAHARELAPWHITVNTVAPGLVETPMTLNSLGGEEIALQAQDFPLGRIATPADVAYAVAWLASREADMMTGQVVAPNGGITIVGI